jgi:hypothetical protein
MSDNVVKLDDFRNAKPSEVDWSTVLDADPEKLKKLLKDIMEHEQTIEEKVRDSGVEVTRMLITELYDIGADPQQEQLADDMIFITMLYTAAVEEFFTKANEKQKGNEFYQHLKELKERVLD